MLRTILGWLRCLGNPRACAVRYAKQTGSYQRFRGEREAAVRRTRHLIADRLREADHR